jgi:hypothetical protein
MTTINSAADFLQELQQRGKTSAAWGALAPGVRIYAADVFLQNAR